MHYEWFILLVSFYLCGFHFLFDLTNWFMIKQSNYENRHGLGKDKIWLGMGSGLQQKHKWVQQQNSLSKDRQEQFRVPKVSSVSPLDYTKASKVMPTYKRTVEIQYRSTHKSNWLLCISSFDVKHINLSVRRLLHVRFHCWNTFKMLFLVLTLQLSEMHGFRWKTALLYLVNWVEQVFFILTD